MEGIPPIDPFRNKLMHLDAQMNEPDFYSDQRRAASIGREHQKLTRLVELYESLMKTEKDLTDNQEMLADPEMDAEMKELAEAELEPLKEEMVTLKERVLVAMIPPEAADDRNIVMEIRAGAGGDEASLFASDLFRMYSRFAERNGWSIEPISLNESDTGGFKEVIVGLKGEEAYRILKFESGVHRVQRIPVTESGGRIHTSTATVAVLPEAEEVDILIDPQELEISVARASGPGGQGVNTTDSAVQILHKPTGMIVKCADERSQLKNKNKAMGVLRSRLLQRKQEEEAAKYAANRKSQVGTGDRSERIRTYNFPQSRITDHRIGLTLHSLDAAMDGEIKEIVNSLHAADNQSKVEALLSGEMEV
ncbi:MAG: peptide chain release factor 1 [Verrucomicrobiota bacterium]